MTSVDLTKNLWLFDVEVDPEENDDVSASHPDVVHHLLERLLAYNKTAAPVTYPPIDAQSAPSLHGGVWSPWQ